MAKKKTAVEAEAAPVAPAAAPTEITTPISELAEAMRSAFETLRPPTRKSPFDRKANTPWTPPPGVAKVKLRRKMYHHGIEVNPDTHSNEELALFNKLRPGKFLDNFVTVRKRNDKGIDIEYPIRTVAQRLRLVNQFGIRNLADLLQRCIDEAAMPKRSVDDYDN